MTNRYASKYGLSDQLQHCNYLLEGKFPYILYMIARNFLNILPIGAIARKFTECLQLRVKDLDFQQAQIIVRSGKGGKDHVTPMPKKVTVNGHDTNLTIHTRVLSPSVATQGYAEC